MKVVRTPTRSSPRRKLVLFAGALGCVAACGTIEGAAPDAPDVGDAGDASDAGDADVLSNEYLVPPECTDTNPFFSAACARALREICEQHVDEPSCGRQRGFAFERGGIGYFRCGWSKVVRFSELTTCQVESVRGRCDLYAPKSYFECPALCEGDAEGGLPYRLATRLRDQELILLPCFGFFAMDGPVGEWSSLYDPQNVEDAYQTCGAHEPPPPKELCDCRRAACDAQ